MFGTLESIGVKCQGPVGWLTHLYLIKCEDVSFDVFPSTVLKASNALWLTAAKVVTEIKLRSKTAGFTETLQPTAKGVTYPYQVSVPKREKKSDKIDWFEVAEECRFKTDLDTEAVLRTGYVTDFASVPRFLWNLVPPHGRMTNAAILHGYKYDNQLGQAEFGESKARLVADLEFVWDCNESGVPASFRLCHWEKFSSISFRSRAFRNIWIW